MPTAPWKTISPIPLLNVRGCDPSTVLLNVMEPAPAPELKVAPPDCKVTGPEKRMAALLALTVWLIDTAPDPNCLKKPFELIVPAAVLVKEPAFVRVIVIGPPLVVVQLPWRTKLTPLRVMPDVPLVFKSPPKVVVAVPFDCVIDAAVIAPVATVPAETIVRSPTWLLVPMEALHVIVPVPAVKVKD